MSYSYRPALGLALAMIGVLATSTLAAAKEPPSAAQLQTIIARHLRASDSYHAGDLLCREDVEPIFNELLSHGIEPLGDREEMYTGLVAENDYLVKLLRGPKGRPFMRRAQELPGAYDVLERLSWFPTGRQTLYRLIHSKDGFAQFQAMLSPGGHAPTEAAFGDEPRARNLFLPTGHIYTEQDLLRRLEAIHVRPASST